MKVKNKILAILVIAIFVISVTGVSALDGVLDNITNENTSISNIVDENKTVNEIVELNKTIEEVNETVGQKKTKNILSASDEEENPMITLKIDYMSTSGEGSSVSTSKNGWTITTKKLEASTGVKPDNPSKYNFTYNNRRYVFNHWEEADTGVVVDANYKKPLTPNGTSYTAHYKAVYDIIEPGNLTVNYIDKFAHGSGSEYHSADNVGYKHTFKVPVDIPENKVVFKYWEREDTGDKYNPNDILTVEVNEYKGKSLNITVNAIYDVKTVVTLDEVTGYTGDIKNITAKVQDAFGNPLNGGTTTLTIGAETYSADVHDGQAEFKDITLGAPGNYIYNVKYTGYDDYKPSEGINAYLPSEGESKINVLPLNTTTVSDDVSGTVGEKVDITANITDQNEGLVQNGTAILKINDKEYTAEVNNGKAVFTGVELPSESTEATIKYQGNDYYNPSNTTIKVTVTTPDEPDDNQTDDNGTKPDDEIIDNQTDNKTEPVDDTNESRINQTDINPIVDNNSTNHDNSSNNTIPVELLKTGNYVGLLLIVLLLVVGLIAVRKL